MSISKYDNLVNQVDSKLLQEWKIEQDKLKSLLIEKNETLNTNLITKVCGFDISVSKYDESRGVVGLCIIDIITFEILYEDYEFVEITQPYVPGFLAFREVDHLIELYSKFKSLDIYYNLIPDVILVDGNGILHSNRFGLASHLGVKLNLPTIGCSKTMFYVDGLTRKFIQEKSSEKLLKENDYFNLIGMSGEIWGVAYRSTNQSYKPIYISIGHMIDLSKSIKIVEKCIRFRVPEPIRICDLTTRKILTEYERLSYKSFDIKDYLKKNIRKYLDKDKD